MHFLPCWDVGSLNYWRHLTFQMHKGSVRRRWTRVQNHQYERRKKKKWTKNNNTDVKRVGLQSESSCLWLPIFPLGLVVLKAHAGGNLCRSLMLTHIFRWLSATAAPAAARQFAHMWVCFSFHFFLMLCFTREEWAFAVFTGKHI